MTSTWRARSVALLALATLLAWAPARGQVAAPSGEELERGLLFEEARAAYAATIAKAPASPEAARAEVRLAYLDAHAEGGFAPLARLERLRRDPAPPDAEVDALAHDSEAFPPGAVVLEARVFCAEHWLRGGDRVRALPMLERAARAAPQDEPIGKHAARRAIELLLEDGDVTGARALLADLGARADTTLVSRVERAGRRRVLARASLAILAAFVASVGLAAARAIRSGRGSALALATRRGFAPACAFSLVIALFGGSLARYHGGDARPFAWFAVAAMPILLGAQALGVGLGSRLRLGRALLGLASALAAAFVTLSLLDARYLEGFGL